MIKTIVVIWAIMFVSIFMEELFVSHPQVGFSASTGSPVWIEQPDGTRSRVGVHTKLPTKYERVWVN